ncbi:hypothetical protein J3R83DRAFT_5229 [Lanmaoa asiatica]|nr:hypothetical protein J3R83DRAFT_5229 [Lanmaoa asiatica]
MGAVESVSGSEQAKAKDEDIIAKGRSEMERGIAQMKGVAVPGSTTAAPESQVEDKAGDQPAKESSGPTPAPPPTGLTQGPVHTDDPQTRQAEPEASRQELKGQTGTENVQQGSRAGLSTPLSCGWHTYLVPETKFPPTGDKNINGEGTDAPRGAGSNV